MRMAVRGGAEPEFVLPAVIGHWPPPFTGAAKERKRYWPEGTEDHPSKNRWVVALYSTRWALHGIEHHGTFVDPCCGVGTFPVAAALAGARVVGVNDLRHWYSQCARFAVQRTKRPSNIVTSTMSGARFLREWNHPEIDAIVLSPDFGDQLHSPGSGEKQKKIIAEKGLGAGHSHRGGDLPGDLSGRAPAGSMKRGKMIDEHERLCGDLYKAAAQRLRPGGRFVVVIRDLVRKQKRVPLAQLHRGLLMAAGLQCPGAARVPGAGGYYQTIRAARGEPTTQEEWCLLARRHPDGVLEPWRHFLGVDHWYREGLDSL